MIFLSLIKSNTFYLAERPWAIRNFENRWNSNIYAFNVLNLISSKWISSVFFKD